MRGTLTSALQLLSLMLMWLQTAESIKCVKCTTLLERECFYGNLPPRECEPTAKHCITWVGKTRAGVLIFRECDKNHINNVCQVKEMEGHKVRVCYETCDTDGCNAAQALRPTTIWAAVLVSLLQSLVVGWRHRC